MTDNDDRKKYKYKHKQNNIIKRNSRFFILIIFVTLSAFYIYSIKTKTGFEELGCLRNAFQNSVLVIGFDEPYYKDNYFIRTLYHKVFGKVIICGPEPDAHSGRFKPDIEFETDRGSFGYNCLGKAIEKNLHYSGYFYINYDVILNWWNLIPYDKNKIWMIGDYTKITNKHSEQRSCHGYRTFLQRLSSNPKFSSFWKHYTKNEEGQLETNDCISRHSSFFYIPKALAEDFSFLSNAAYVNTLDRSMGPANIMESLVDTENIIKIPSFYQPPQYRSETSPLFWENYNKNIAVTYSYRLYQKNPKAWEMNRYMVVKHYSPIADELSNC